jgi:hypothetical protein
MFAIVQRERMYHEGQTPDYETAALPAELRRHERPNIASWQGCGKASVIVLLMLMVLLVIEIVKRSRQYERLADLAQCDAFGSFTERDLEALNRLSQRFEAEAEGLMVHRQDKLCAGGGCHLYCLLRCAV